MSALTVEQAEDLAARTLAAIDDYDVLPMPDAHFAADRARVASDLAGLIEHREYVNDDDPGWCAVNLHADWPCADARRYADGLRLTAALYGVTS